jgi:hypothetical protein
MRMAAYHRAPLPVLPTVNSPPSSPAPSQTLPQSAVTAALDSNSLTLFLVPLVSVSTNSQSLIPFSMALPASF